MWYTLNYSAIFLYFYRKIDDSILQKTLKKIQENTSFSLSYTAKSSNLCYRKLYVKYKCTVLAHFNTSPVDSFNLYEQVGLSL